MSKLKDIWEIATDKEYRFPAIMALIAILCWIFATIVFFSII